MVSIDDIGPGILDGLRVLDFTRVVAGPCLTRVLADLGAEVIKVEPPEGDLMRAGWPRRGDIAALFAGQNAGKRFVALDLGKPAAVELALDLAEQCDVVVENYRPGVAEKLGVGYEAVRARRGDIVYCSVSGYGQQGRAAHRRAYAPVVHAEVGLLHHKAKEWGVAPRPEPVSHADMAAGMAGAQGVLAALWRRERTGVGAYVDASMCEAMIAQNEWTVVEVNGGPDYERSPFRPAKAAVVRLGDDEQTWVAIPGSPAAVFVAYARLSHQPELLAEERFATMAARVTNMEACVEHLSAWAASFDSFEAFEDMLSDGARLPVGRVLSIADTVRSDWATDRGAYVEVPSGAESVLVNRSALRISGTDTGPRGGVKALGADNRTVLDDLLDLGPVEIEALVRSGALVADEH
ncbi:MAG: CoA transferase [Acidimicrobiia bacterium]|nr:CoA transferase [Acidimicrobiia bacterium]